jgi:hypothetical protein
MPEPYQSPDWALVPAKPAQGLNTNNNNKNGQVKEESVCTAVKVQSCVANDEVEYS